MRHANDTICGILINVFMNERAETRQKRSKQIKPTRKKKSFAKNSNINEFSAQMRDLFRILNIEHVN